MVLITDDFNRLDTNSLGNNWSLSQVSTNPGSGWTIGANRAVVGSTDTALAVHKTNPGAADHFAQITLGSSGASTGVLLCATAPTGAQDTSVGGYLIRHNGANLGIFKFTAGNGSLVSLASATHTRLGGQILRGVRSGADIIAYIDGVEIVRAAESGFTGGLVGFRAGGTSKANLDDFKAGTLADMSALDASTPTPATVAPGQVVGLAAGTPTSASVPLTWALTSDTTSYLVDYKTSASPTWLPGPAPTRTATTVTGLDTGTAYDFRVTARNAAGLGSPSATVSAPTSGATAPTTPTTPVPPTASGGMQAPYRGLMVNRAGEMIPPGEPAHTLRTDPYGPAGPWTPPPWLTATGTVALGADQGGYISVQAGSLLLTPGLATTDVAAVKIELDHVRWAAASPASATLVVSAGDTTIGARAAQASADTYARLTSAGGSTDAFLSHMGADAARRRRIGLLVSFATKEAWLLDGNQITGYRDCTTGWTDGGAPIGVTVGGATALRLASLTITTYQ